MSGRFILSLKYTAASPAAGKSVGGFLRYVQYRDHHQEVDRDRESRGMLKYVAHRDRTAPGGRLFGRDSNVGDLERRQLSAHIARSTRNIQPGRRPERAAYRIVLSPENAEGLDLKALTRAAMQELERELGQLPPWIAAIHRNTKHPHVHVVMAARRETERGQFRTIMISRERLARMKVGVARDMARQLGHTNSLHRTPRTRDLFFPDPKQARRPHKQRFALVEAIVHAANVKRSVAIQLRKMARRQRQEFDQELLERERERERIHDQRHQRSR